MAAPGATQTRLGLLNVKKEPQEDVASQPGCTPPFKDVSELISEYGHDSNHYEINTDCCLLAGNWIRK